MTISEGTLLGGRVRYAQRVEGYRTGIEPVLLAAAIPASPGDCVLEAGTGAGAALLCLAARVPGIRGVGVERDASQAALAEGNLAANGFDTITVETADLLGWQTAVRFDHAFANPPWHDAAGSPSPNASRASSKRGCPGLYAGWAAALARSLRPRGTVTLIVPAADLADATAALHSANCREVRVFPFWPKRQVPAKLLILQGVFQGRGPCAMLAGLTLHENAGHFTADAEKILRDGAELLLSGVQGA